MSSATILMRVICTNPPAGAFGLQDKKQDILRGIPLDAARLAFSFELTACKTEDGLPDFAGPFVHGRPAQRFLYLTTKARLTQDEWQIVRRIKVPLRSIQWAQVEAVLGDPDRCLEAQVSGRSTGTVPLLGDGWTVRAASTPEAP